MRGLDLVHSIEHSNTLANISFESLSLDLGLGLLEDKQG